MPSPQWLLAEQILVGSWRTSVGFFDGGHVAERDGVVVAMTGIESPSNNPAFVTAEPSDPVVALQWGIDERRGLATGYDIPVGRRPGIEAALDELGHVHLLERSAMVLRVSDLRPRPAPTGLALERVDSSTAIEEVARVQAAGFGSDAESELAALPLSLVTARSSCLVLGRVDGDPVTCALGSRGPGGVAIFGVATTPSTQGNGYATAATALAIQSLARADEHAVLQASTSGQPVYAAMGFVDVGPWALWVAPAERDAKVARDAAS